MQQQTLIDEILRSDLELSEKAEMAERMARQRLTRPKQTAEVEVERPKAARDGKVN